MKNTFILFFYATCSFILFLSCKHDKINEDATYFGGQIVNPKSSKVYFLLNEKFLDSAYLDKNNRFLFKFDKLTPSLYTFSHGNEYQYVYLEPKDSIILRLNTWDFDESLVFIGKGSERNNFLMNLFLNDELEDRTFMPFFLLPPDAFSAKIDSALKLKQNLYNQFKTNAPKQSDLFDKFAKVTLNYPLYSKKENYPLYNKRKLNLDSLPLLDSTFYEYRKQINLNDSSLVYFYPYRNYINAYIHHNAYEKKSLLPETNVSLNMIENIIEAINQKELKNLFLYRTIYDSFFYHDLTDKQRETEQALFYKNCDEQKYVKEIKQLSNDYKNIKKGTKLIEFKVINTKGVEILSSDIIKNEKTVLYFWSEKLINTNNLSKRVRYLQQSYPNLNFIGINIDKHKETWLKSKIFTFLPQQNQFHLAHNCVMRNFITSTTPRIILLNKNEIVANGFTVLWATNFEDELSLLNKN